MGRQNSSKTTAARERRIHNEKVLYRSRQFGSYSTVFLIACIMLILGAITIQYRNIALFLSGASVGTVSHSEFNMIVVGVIGATIFLILSILCRIMGEKELEQIID